MAKKSKPNPKPSPTVVEAHDPASLPGALKRIGGSMSDDWNNIIANQTLNGLWYNNSDSERVKKQYTASLAGLIGISRTDELEGMLAAQLIACHNALMECYRRAMIGEQTFEGWRENLSQANKLSRTYATLLEALNIDRSEKPASIIRLPLIAPEPRQAHRRARLPGFLLAAHRQSRARARNSLPLSPPPDRDGISATSPAIG